MKLNENKVVPYQQVSLFALCFAGRMAGVSHWGDFEEPAIMSARPALPSSVMPKLKPLPSSPPDLVQIGSSEKREDTKEVEFGVGSTDFLHSLQLQIFLKKSANGQQQPLPVLKPPISSTVLLVKELVRKDVLTLIRRVVTLMCVDGGYERASETCIDLLTESCGRFIDKLCTELAAHHNSQQWSSTCGEEYLYQLLDETGFSVPSLHYFAKSISDRKNDRLLRVNRLYGHVADSGYKTATNCASSSNISQMIVGLGEDAASAVGDEKIWDQTLDEISEMTDEEILQSLSGT